jgi:hypothetical protein
LTADFDFYSLQLSLVAGGVINFCWLNVVEDEDESTRAGGCGQLHMFGAVEEKVGRGFSGWVAGQEFGAGLSFAMWRAGSEAGSNWEWKSGDVDQDNFHRWCTGNAESQLSVLSSIFCVGFISTKNAATDFRGFPGVKRICEWGRVQNPAPHKFCR